MIVKFFHSIEPKMKLKVCLSVIIGTGQIDARLAGWLPRVNIHSGQTSSICVSRTLFFAMLHSSVTVSLTLQNDILSYIFILCFRCFYIAIVIEDIALFIMFTLFLPYAFFMFIYLHFHHCLSTVELQTVPNIRNQIVESHLLI